MGTRATVGSQWESGRHFSQTYAIDKNLAKPTAIKCKTGWLAGLGLVAVTNASMRLSVASKHPLSALFIGQTTAELFKNPHTYLGIPSLLFVWIVLEIGLLRQTRQRGPKTGSPKFRSLIVKQDFEYSTTCYRLLEARTISSLKTIKLNNAQGKANNIFEDGSILSFTVYFENREPLTYRARFRIPTLS